jgi:hypothetical protein
MSGVATRLARNIAVLCLAAAVTAGESWATPPARVVLVYELVRDGQPIADVVETLEHGAGRYAIVSEGRAKGVLAALPLGAFRRESRGEVTSGGLRPETFREQRGARLAVASFDWNAREVVTEFRGRAETHPLDGPVHDRLTQLYAFAFAPAPSGEVSMRVTDGRGLSAQRYVVAAREPLATAAGTFDALRLERIHEPGDSRSTVVWLAAERHYLPVRVLLVERDGARLDQTLARLEE